MDGQKLRVHLFISGRVQGIGFRSGTIKKAQSLSLVGWVRNLPDGRVEVVAEGEKENLEKFVAWCQQGPLFAKVENSSVTWDAATDGFDRFEVRW